jgi:hypothetical protein
MPRERMLRQLVLELVSLADIVGSTTSTWSICQVRQPHSEGRAYFDRKVAEGKTKRDELPPPWRTPCLLRRVNSIADIK